MDFTPVIGFFSRNMWTIIFYSAMILLIVLLRKRIEWQTFGIGLYKTKVGLKLMDKLGTKYRGWVRIFGYISIAIAFIGMAYIFGMLVYGIWALAFKPSAPPILQPVIPGVTFPGQEITIPLIIGWIALFTLIVIHEFSHGVVARAHDVPIKSSGLLIFGPLGGAFVEPDEKKLAKQHESAQYSMIAAGPASNIITAVLFLVISALVLTPVLDAITAPAGVEIASAPEGYPAYAAGIREHTIITGVNGVPVKDVAELSTQMDNVTVGESVVFNSQGKSYAVTTVQNPGDKESTKGYVGITMQTRRDPIYAGTAWIVATINGLLYFLKWFFILSVGIGLANLLPIGPVDGGRILQLATRSVAKDKKRGDWWWSRISMLTLGMIIILLIAFFLRPLFI